MLFCLRVCDSYDGFMLNGRLEKLFALFGEIVQRDKNRFSTLFRRKNVHDSLRGPSNVALLR